MKKTKKWGNNKNIQVKSHTFLIITCSILTFVGIYLLVLNNTHGSPYAFSETQPNYYCLGPNNCGNSVTILQKINSQNVVTNQSSSLQVSSAPQVSSAAAGVSPVPTPCTTTKTNSKQKDKNNYRLGNIFQELLNFIIQLIIDILKLGNTGTNDTPCNPPGPTQPVAMLTQAVSTTITQIPMLTPSIAIAPISITIAAPTVTPIPSPVPTATPIPTVSPIPTATTAPTSTPVPTVSVGQTVNIPAQDGSNYSGYSYNIAAPAVNDTVQGTWSAVSVTCSTANIISPWIGMGDNPNTETNLAQLGFDIDCSGGSPVYKPWTEALPADLIYYDNDPIAVGDQITASVTYQGNGTFNTKMTDAQQKWSITLPMTYAAGYKAQGGEFILEEVLGNGIPTYSPVTFTNSMFSLGSLTALQPLSSAQGLMRYNFTHGNTSTLTGSTFTISY